MKKVNFAYHTGEYASTPPELVGMFALGGGGLMEAPYRHFGEVRRFKAMVGSLNRQLNVLELGSGNGRWVGTIAPLVGHYTAVDLTPEAVAIARETAAKKQIDNVAFYEMSITDFRGDRPYDVIYFSGVSQFLDDDALGGVLSVLAPWMKPTTIIIDRSTLNIHERSVTNTDDYFSIYRTPAELDGILRDHGFECVERTPSYRILRGMNRLRDHPRRRLYLERLVRATRPLSLFGMLFVTFLADVMRPTDVSARGWSHDFSLYRKAR